MYLPDYLFYQPELFVTQVDHTTQFTGRLDVPACLTLDPNCWFQDNVVESEKHKKILVLSDFCFDKDNKRLESVIDDLIDEGFTLYLWQETDCVEISRKNKGWIFKGNEFAKCAPTHPKIIETFMAKKKIIPASMKILSAYDIDHLYEEIELRKSLPKRKPGLVSVEDISKSRFTPQTIEENTPDFCVFYEHTSPAKFRSMLPNHGIVLKALKITKVVLSHAKKTISSEDDVEQFQNGHQVIEVTIGSAVNSLFVDAVLAITTNARTLIIEGLPALSRDAGIFPSIEKIVCTTPQVISNDTFAQLIRKCPNLKVIDFGDEHFWDIFDYLEKNGILANNHLTFVFKGIKFNDPGQLSRLNLYLNIQISILYFDTPIDKQTLLSICQRIKKVKTIKFSKRGPDELINSTVQLPTVHRLVNIWQDDFISLHSSMPNIESLDLVTPAAYHSAGLVTASLHKLKYTSLSSFLSHDLTELAQTAPNLSIFDLTLAGTHSLLPANNNQPTLSALKRLKLKSATGAQIPSVEAFERVCERMPTLEDLSIDAGTFLLVNMPIKGLKKLKKLELTNYGTANPYQLLTNSPDLEELSISPKKNKEIFVTNSTAISSLITVRVKKLSIGSIKIAIAVYEFIRRSVNLEELNLPKGISVDNLFVQLARHGIKLPSLRKLDVSESDLTYVGYFALKQIATPTLKEVNISYTPAAASRQYNETDFPDLKAAYNPYTDDERQATHSQQINVEPPTARSASGTHPDHVEFIGNNDTQTRNHLVRADTTPIKCKYKTTRIFTNLQGGPHPHVSTYRNCIYDDFTFTDDLTNPVCLTANPDLDLVPYEDYDYGKVAMGKHAAVAKQSAELYLQGEHEMRLTPDFTPLPSHHANDKLVAVHIEGVPKEWIEIQFSRRYRQYCIRSTLFQHHTVNIDYIVATPPQAPINNPELRQWVAKFRNFDTTGKPLKTGWIFKPRTAQAVLELMYDQELGRCEQRAAMFKHYAKQKFPNVQVLIPTNDAHAFVDVVENGNWIKCDLGGHPADLEVAEPAVRVPHAIDEPSPDNLQVAASTSASTADTRSNMVPSRILSQEEQFALLDPKHITWQNTTNVTTLNPFQQAMVSLGQNVLLTGSQTSAVESVFLHIQQLAKQQRRPIFIIEKPNQIACAGLYVKREADDTGTQFKGPGGPLHDYLSQDFDKTHPPILLVKWNDFPINKLVQCNSLIDEHRFADGTPIPEEMTVIGVYDTHKPGAYKGSDFHSRNTKFTVTEADVAKLGSFQVDIPSAPPIPQSVPIELYGSPHWKEILLGRWQPRSNQIVFVEGEFASALKQGKPVHFKNAPWHIPAFTQFLQQAKIHGQIPTTGDPLLVPENFWSQVTQSTGYQWSDLITNLNIVTTIDPAQPHLALHANNLYHFLPHAIIDQKRPQAVNGLFEHYTNQSVTLIITQSFSAPSWHQLLVEAKRWNVRLQLMMPPGITLPESLAQVLPVVSSPTPLAAKDSVNLIQSTDVYASMQQIKATQPNALAINVSEFDYSDIFYTAKASQEARMEFIERYSDVFKALQKGQSVILYGRFKEDLKNACLEIALKGGLHINGQYYHLPGQLSLISEKPLSGVVQTQVDSPPQSSLAQIHPGMFDLKLPSSNDDRLNLSPAHVENVCLAFINQRLGSLRSTFSAAFFAFVAGLTGVAKSTFIKKYLTEANGFALYFEKQALKAWALDRRPGLIKTLFLDEANMGNLDYSQFEMMNGDPPQILIDGELIPLTPEHKLLLAGNPMSYGGERHLPNLVKQHGNVIVFDVMPVETIYQEILAPIFKASNCTAGQMDRFSQCILKTYQHICALSTNEVLITPRELKMMAMMIAQSQDRDNQYENMVYEVALQCLPKENKAAFEQWFASHYHTQELASDTASALVNPSGKAFILTESRKPIDKTMQRLLAVRELVITSSDPALHEAGLGGMILEGEPGGGKSHFMIDGLMKRGFKPLPLDLPEDAPAELIAKGFYVIPSSMSYTDKRELLIKAFNQGAMVVMDELNSGPLMEPLINPLLMGEHPVTKAPPARRGFMLFGTQNPIDMDGRQVATTAILRRVFFYECNAYTANEMKQILTQSYPQVPVATIEQEINNHQNAVQYAKQYHLDPMPVFRNLENIVKTLAKSFTRNKRAANDDLNDDLEADQTHPDKKSRLQPEAIIPSASSKQKRKQGTDEIPSPEPTTHVSKRRTGLARK